MSARIDLSRLVTDRQRFAYAYGGGTFGATTDEQGVRRPASAKRIIETINDHYRVKVFDESQIFIAYEGFSENIDRKILSHILQVIEDAFKRDFEVVLLTCGTDAMSEVATIIEYWLKLNQEWLCARRNPDGSQKKTIVRITGSNHPLGYENTDAWDNFEFSVEDGNECLASSDGTNLEARVMFHRRKIPPSNSVKGPPNGEPQGVDFYDGESDEYLSKIWPLHTMRSMVTVGKLETYLRSRVAYNPFNPFNGDGHFLLYDVNKILDSHAELCDRITPGFTKAVLLMLFHSGTANTNPNRPDLSVAKLVNNLRKEHGIVCFGVTENEEPVNLRAYETGVALRENGLVPCYNMGYLESAAKICAYSRGVEGVELIRRVLQNTVGEIDPNAITDAEDLLKYHAARERLKVMV